MLSASLRLVASLTNLLARCLGIVLPHPVLLWPLLVTKMNVGLLQVQRGRGNHGEDGGGTARNAIAVNNCNTNNKSSSNRNSSSNTGKTGGGSSVSKKTSALAAVSNKARRGIVAAISSGT